MSLATDVRPSSPPPEPPPSTPSHLGDRYGDRYGDRLDRLRGVAPTTWALVALLAGTGVLYLWGLGESGWANSFYSAAAQAGSESWKAFFFGSSDASNSITVDKTPLSLWPMALSVKIFGLSSWSILVPQALMGVGTVWLLTATVRRTTGSAVAGLVAGLTMALTPVAVLMFRFNNPDALLTLLLVGAAAATLRACEEETSRPVRWLALAGALVGAAFLTKMLQAFLVLPALGLAYLLLGSAPLLKRLAHLAVGSGAMLLTAGWWVAIVSLWPASSRPYIGGSQDNSILELTLGYNGLGRLTGDEEGSVGGGGGWGSTGLGRLLNSEIGGQIGWLLPTALLLLVAGFWFTRRAPRTGTRAAGVRAALVVWGGWLLVTAATFSFMAGIFHAYYTVALAPAVAAVVGIGAWLLWEHRESLVAAFVASVAVALTTVLAFLLLGRTEEFVPWLRWVVLPVGLVAALLVAGLARMPRRLAATVAATALVVSLAGPAAYAVETAATPHSGSIPSAGPAGQGGLGGGRPPGAQPGNPPQGQQGQLGQPGQLGGFPGGAMGNLLGGGGIGVGIGGLLTGSEASPEMVALLQADAQDYTWVAAAVGSNTAAGYQLASEQPVMAIGGFNGSDPSPTLAQFQAYVAEGAIHYFIGGGGFAGQRGGSEASGEIAAWVADTFASTSVDGVTVYDLTQPLTTTDTTSDTTTGTTGRAT